MKLYELDTVSESLAAQVPDHLRKGINEYVWYGRPTGGFLRAVLTNDLFMAIGRADHQSLSAIGSIVSYVYNAVPNGCHGDAAKVDAHIARGRKQNAE